jgi:hypothetical protein
MLRWTTGHIQAGRDDQAEATASLGDSASYSTSPDGVERFETQGALAFPAGEEAWKTKRPVRFPTWTSGAFRHPRRGDGTVQSQITLIWRKGRPGGRQSLHAPARRRCGSPGGRRQSRREALRDRAPINRRSGIARSVVAHASRCLRAYSRGSPGRSTPAVGRRRPDEAAPLQPRGEQARALPVVPDHLDDCRAGLGTRAGGGSCASFSCTRSAGGAKPLRKSVWPVASHTRTPAGTGIIAEPPRPRR